MRRASKWCLLAFALGCGLGAASCTEPAATVRPIDEAAPPAETEPVPGARAATAPTPPAAEAPAAIAAAATIEARSVAQPAPGGDATIAPTPSEPPPSLRDVVRRVVRMPRDRAAQRLARSRGLRFVDLTWEDTGRSYGSSIGPNISDLTLEIIDRSGRRPRTNLLPVLRFPNFSDRTADIPADRIAVHVGNAREGAPQQTALLRDVLSHLRDYLSRPEDFRAASDDFSAPRDTHYLVSAQHVFVPVPPGERVDFAPVLFNYQSEPGVPAVLCLLVTREGTSVQVIENRYDPSLPDGWGQRLYFDDRGRRTVLTAERQGDVAARVEAGEARPDDATALERGADMVMIVQVPLRLPVASPRRAASPSAASMDALGGGAGGGYAAPSSRAVQSDVETAVVGHGLDEGPFAELRRLRIRRDPRFPVRVTVQFYKATSNGVVDESDVDEALAQIQRVYDDADFVGSLVVGSLQRPTAWQTN